eukprot:CFRG6650T1
MASPTPSPSPVASPTASIDCGIQGTCEGPTSLSAFGLSVAISACVGVALMICFIILRKQFKRFYTARPIYLPVLQIRPLPNTWMSWVWPFITTPDDVVAQAGGLDVYMCLQMYKIGIAYFTVITILGLAVILPINKNGTNNLSEFNGLSISNISSNNNVLWVHYCFMWLFSFILFYFLHVNYQKQQKMHYHWLQSGQPHGYTLVVKNIPKVDRTDENLKKVFSYVFPDTVHSVSLYTYVRPHRKLIERREQIRSDLERAYWELGHYHTRPKMRLDGFWKWGGTIVDSISYLTEELAEYNLLVTQSKYNSFRYPYGTGFVTFKNLVTASLAASSRMSDDSTAYQTETAPEPTDIYWSNLRISSVEKLVRNISVKILTIAMVIFFVIPVAFLQSFVTIENFQIWIPELEQFFIDNPGVTALLRGFIPALILNIIMFLIPHLCKGLAILEGQPAYSKIEFSRMNKIFYFNVFNVYFASVFGSTVVKISSIWDLLINNPWDFFEVVGRTIPGNAAFFINYIMVKIFITLNYQLIDLVELLITSVKLWFFARTPRERLSAMKPDSPEFAFFASDLILVYLLGLCFACIAPLLLPFALAYMAWGYWIRRYQLLYVRVPKFESGGRFWNLFFSRVCISLAIAQATLMGILLVMEFWVAPSMLILIAITGIFYQVEDGWYNSNTMPLLLAQDVDEDRTDIDGDGGIAFLNDTAYVHPSLTSEENICPEDDMMAMQQVHQKWLKTIRRTDTVGSLRSRKTSADMYKRKSIHSPEPRKIDTLGLTSNENNLIETIDSSLQNLASRLTPDLDNCPRIGCSTLKNED